jgi:hypothetical protein
MRFGEDSCVNNTCSSVPLSQNSAAYMRFFAATLGNCTILEVTLHVASALHVWERVLLGSYDLGKNINFPLSEIHAPN